MGILERAKDIKSLGQRNFWVLYGKSGTGKTKIIGSFPKPLLYIQIGDDGSNTISDVEGIKALRVESSDELKTLLKELKTNKTYKTIACDTFSLITNVWIDQNIVQKKKRMTQNDWGSLKIETEDLIKSLHELALGRNVVVSCHESNDSIEGMEDEILPDIRPSVTKGARTYLEGMANYGLHCTKMKKTVTVKKTGEDREIIRYCIHIGANPYYWTKLQINSEVVVPELMVNPTYDKVLELLSE